MLMSGLELVVAIAALAAAGHLLVQAWDRQLGEHRQRKRRRRS
jgi:hypothetical protein